MKKRNIIALACAGTLIIGAFTGLTGFAKDNANDDSISAPHISLTIAKEDIEETEEAVQTEEKELTGIAAVAAKAMPAVVSITNKSIKEVQDMYDMFDWGWGFNYGWGGYGNRQPRQYESTSAGSGVIIGKTDTELLIVTNYHVIEDANELTVGFVDDEIVQASIKGTAEDNDLAVISVALDDMKQETIDAISVIEIGNSDDLELGEEVVVIGNALGYGQSVTHGILSAKNRHIDLDGYEDISLLQTDAPINGGNSGGALLDMNGDLIGINSAKVNTALAEGIGYAIPISDVDELIEDMMNSTQRTEKVTGGNSAYMGISGQDVSAEMNQLYGIPEGIYITTVEEGSAADKAGLQKGDVIVKFGTNRLSSMAELKDELSYYEAGETVTITISKANDGEYEEQEVEVTLGARSDYMG